MVHNVTALPSGPSADVLREIETYKQTINRLDAEKKELQATLNSNYSQMQKLNESLVTLTNDLQQ